MPDKHLALLISCNHRKKPRVERVGRVHREMSINHQKPSEWIHHNHHDRHHHSYFLEIVSQVKSSQANIPNSNPNYLNCPSCTYMAKIGRRRRHCCNRNHYYVHATCIIRFVSCSWFWLCFNLQI